MKQRFISPESLPFVLKQYSSLRAGVYAQEARVRGYEQGGGTVSGFPTGQLHNGLKARRVAAVFPPHN